MNSGTNSKYHQTPHNSNSTLTNQPTIQLTSQPTNNESKKNLCNFHKISWSSSSEVAAVATVIESNSIPHSTSHRNAVLMIWPKWNNKKLQQQQQKESGEKDVSFGFFGLTLYIGQYDTMSSVHDGCAAILNISVRRKIGYEKYTHVRARLDFNGIVDNSDYCCKSGIVRFFICSQGHRAQRDAWSFFLFRLSCLLFFPGVLSQPIFPMTMNDETVFDWPHAIQNRNCIELEVNIKMPMNPFSFNKMNGIRCIVNCRAWVDITSAQIGFAPRHSFMYACELTILL